MPVADHPVFPVSNPAYVEEINDIQGISKIFAMFAAYCRSYALLADNFDYLEFKRVLEIGEVPREAT